MSDEKEEKIVNAPQNPRNQAIRNGGVIPESGCPIAKWLREENILRNGREESPEVALEGQSEKPRPERNNAGTAKRPKLATSEGAGPEHAALLPRTGSFRSACRRSVCRRILLVRRLPPRTGSSGTKLARL